VFFSDLQNSLVESLRDRVRNGELTERSLARLVGVSQPHMHNVLKGARLLSPSLVDQILQQLRLSVLDLIDRDYLSDHLQASDGEEGLYAYLPVLQGQVGPSHSWPASVERYERFPVQRSTIAGMHSPVVAKLADDPRMFPLFTAGDLVLLDQTHQVRTAIEQDSYYIVKRGQCGLVRRLRLSGRTLYLIPEDGADHPAGWERVSLDGMQIQHVVRAKAMLLAKPVEWTV
jgi:hypothetical protein